MKIHILSDLHLEFGGFDDYEPPVGIDAVILAGDIHVGTSGLEWACAVFDVPVLYVAGNHEYYKGELDFKTGIDDLKKYVENKPHIHVLERDAVVIDGVRFLGATLWTDLELHNNSAYMTMQSRWIMNDYQQITENGRLITPAHTVASHQRAIAFLQENLDEDFGGKTVIATHHLPTEQACYPEYGRPPENLLNPFFASRLDDLIINSGASLWAFGHTHCSRDFKIGDTRLVCNPRGYHGYEENKKFKQDLVVEV